MHVRRCTLALAAVAGLLAAVGPVACFDGVGTIGAICFAADQCGLGQTCTNSVCGKCSDRDIQAGELCFGNSSEENVFGEVTDLLAYDPEDDGQNPLLITTVNTNCLAPPNSGPPAMGESACWRVYAMLVDDDGDFEITNPFDRPNNDGRVPQAATGNFDGSGTTDLALAIFPNDPLVDPSQLVVAHDLALTDDGPISREFDISVRPQAMFAADLDGNGLDDLLIAGEASSSLVLLRARPGYEFEAELLLTTIEASPLPCAPIDMDGDGDLDVPIVSGVDAVVSVYLNNGAGFIARAGSAMIEAPRTPTGLAAADFDHDGNVDLAVWAAAPFDQSGVPPEQRIESEIRIYAGGGDGSLSLQQTLPGGEYPVFGLALDVNHDGWADIVVADLQEDKLPVHINRGGSFPDFVTIDVAAAPRTLMYEDFDRDGIPDLVVGNANGVVAVVPAQN